MLPSQYMGLGRREKAFVIAAIQFKIEADKIKEQEIKREAKRK